MGYPVKLDTNGTQPEVLKDLAEKDLIQMAAVDIKACPENYPSLTGLLKPDLDAVKETVDFLLHGKLDYEFRTTVVRELHSEEDFHKIGVWLKGAKAYYLQAYRDSDEVLQLDSAVILWKNWNISGKFFWKISQELRFGASIRRYQ